MTRVSIYTGYLRGPVTLRSIAERSSVELSLPVLRLFYCWYSNIQPSACETYALTHCAIAPSLCNSDMIYEMSNDLLICLQLKRVLKYKTKWWTVLLNRKITWLSAWKLTYVIMYWLKISVKTKKNDNAYTLLMLITKWLGNHSIIHYQIRMDIMMIDSTLNPSDIDKPTQQVSSFLSSGDLDNTSTLWLTVKYEICTIKYFIQFDLAFF